MVNDWLFLLGKRGFKSKFINTCMILLDNSQENAEILNR